MDNPNATPRKQKQRRIWPILLLTFCFLVSAAAGALLASSSLFDIDLKKEPVPQIERMNLDTELIKARDKSTILIMGVDVRKDDTGRSDTMMVATVDPKYDHASLLSIPRDTRVRIYGYGYDKINAAFAYGGEPLAEKTVENFLGIDIDHYVVIDVKSFVKIIDAIGGIDINVEKRMKYEDPWDDNGGLYINIFPGKQHMDGKKAVTYVRYRDSEGDIGRIERQQKFIEACLDKVMSPSFIPRIPAVIREVSDAIDTDMTFRQLLELAGALKAAQQNGLSTDMVPGYPLYIDDVSYWIPYIEELQYAMARLLDVSVDSKIKQRAEKVASEYNESIPSNARKIPDGAEIISDTERHSNYDDYYDAPSRSSYDYDDTPSRSNYDDYSYSRSNYDDDSYSRSNYDEDSYSRSNYDDDSYSRSNYDDDSYSRSNYDEDSYSRSNYDEDSYSRSNYDEDSYSRSNYDEDSYSRSNYDEDSYSRSNYDDDSYSRSNYDDYYYDAPTRDDSSSKDR